MATLRQKVDALLLRAEEADTEERMVEVLEGKKVEVSSRPSRRQTFGKRTPRFTAWIDGERVEWHSRKNEVRSAIIALVDPVKIAERVILAEQARVNEARREAEQKAAEERLAPLRTDIQREMNDLYANLKTFYLEKGFNEYEIVSAFHLAASNIRVSPEADDGAQG